jgi:hypothetical protein
MANPCSKHADEKNYTSLFICHMHVHIDRHAALKNYKFFHQHLITNPRSTGERAESNKDPENEAGEG